MSVTAALAVGGNACPSTSSARSDCGLFVGLPSVVNAPPSSARIATTAATTTAVQTPIVRHGRRALAAASACVESFISHPLLSRPSLFRDLHRLPSRRPSRKLGEGELRQKACVDRAYDMLQKLLPIRIEYSVALLVNARPSSAAPSAGAVGTRPFSTLSPSAAKVAGRNVRDPTTVVATARIIPIANDENSDAPAKNNPASEIMTVTPETTTARPEVAAAASTGPHDRARRRAPRAHAADRTSSSRRRPRARSGRSPTRSTRPSAQAG